MSEIDRAMLQSMAASFRGALEFSFNRHDMAELMDRCVTRTDLTTPPADYVAGLRDALDGLRLTVLPRELPDDHISSIMWEVNRKYRDDLTIAQVKRAYAGILSEMNGRATKPLAAALAALDAAEARAVGVKPLVWVPEDAPCTRFKAEALGGHMMIVELDPATDPGKYSVGFDLGGLCFKFVLAEYDDFPPKYTAPAKFDGIEAAQAAAQADYEARILSALHPASPLGAVAMREKAAKIADNVSRGQYHMDDAPDAIRALPLPTDAELLAAAAELPEVQALVSAATSAKLILAEYEPHPLLMLGGLLAALAPFTRKGE